MGGLYRSPAPAQEPSYRHDPPKDIVSFFFKLLDYLCQSVSSSPSLPLLLFQFGICKISGLKLIEIGGQYDQQNIFSICSRT